MRDSFKYILSLIILLILLIPKILIEQEAPIENIKKTQEIINKEIKEKNYLMGNFNPSKTENFILILKCKRQQIKMK